MAAGKEGVVPRAGDRGGVVLEENKPYDLSMAVHVIFLKAYFRWIESVFASHGPYL
jgi:hypothetical protein